METSRPPTDQGWRDVATARERAMFDALEAELARPRAHRLRAVARLIGNGLTHFGYFWASPSVIDEAP